MNTKLLMRITSLFLGVMGIAATFAPTELLSWLSAPTVEPLPVIVQLLGALSFAFAMADWTAKDSLIGGIHGRALTFGNCVHFTMGALALLKHGLAYGFGPLVTGVLLAYGLLALCFGALVFGILRPRSSP